MEDCKTCELTAKRDRGDAPLWDNIVRTEHWDVVHAYNSSLLGWLVLVCRRHIGALHEMTSAEANQLGSLIQQASSALQQVVGCAKTYVIQFAEHPEHPHVHFHIVPRMADHPPEFKSVGIFGYLGASDDKYVSEGDMNRIAQEIRSIMTQGTLN